MILNKFATNAVEELKRLGFETRSVQRGCYTTHIVFLGDKKVSSRMTTAELGCFLEGQKARSDKTRKEIA